MAYVTAEEIVARLGTTRAIELTTDSGTSADKDLIDTIIGEVEPDVEAALRKRTRATITQSAYPKTWAMIQGKVVDLTIFRLAMRRPPVPDDWKLGHTNATEWLSKLAAGEIDLPDVGANGPAPDYGFAREDAGAKDMI